jgi:hypothetical protein
MFELRKNILCVEVSFSERRKRNDAYGKMNNKRHLKISWRILAEVRVFGGLSDHDTLLLRYHDPGSWWLRP